MNVTCGRISVQATRAAQLRHYPHGQVRHGRTVGAPQRITKGILARLVAVALLTIWLGSWNETAHAATCTSVTSGNWNAITTWSLIVLLGCGGIIGRTPTAGDDVYISNGTTVTVNAATAAASTVTTYSTGTLRFNTAGNSLTVGGALTNGGTILFNATGTVNVNGAFTSSGTVTNNAAGTLNLDGSATVNGTFAAGSGTVAFNGTSAQNVSGSALGFYNVTVNNASGMVLGNDLASTGTLLFTSGKITTGSNKVTVGTGGTISGAGSATGYVVGYLEKLFAGAGSFTFEIGDASTYTPVAVSVSALGNLKLSTATPDHPNISTSLLDVAYTVNRYWTISSSGLPGTYRATFNFPHSEIDLNAAPANFQLQRYAAAETPPWSTVTVGARTSTSTQATGLTAVGDFAIGEFKRKVKNEFIYLRENY